MAYFPLNSQQNIPSQEIQRNFVGGELSVVSSGLFYLRLATRGQLESFILFPSLNNIQCQRHSCRRLEWKVRFIFSWYSRVSQKKSCKPVHSISKTLFIWDILRIFVPVARDGRLKGWKLSAAPGVIDCIHDYIDTWLLYSDPRYPLSLSDSYWVLQVCFLQVLSTDERRLVVGRKVSLKIHFI